jgi:hypothetical protein
MVRGPWYEGYLPKGKIRMLRLLTLKTRKLVWIYELKVPIASRGTSTLNIDRNGDGDGCDRLVSVSVRLSLLTRPQLL